MTKTPHSQLQVLVLCTKPTITRRIRPTLNTVLYKAILAIPFTQACLNMSENKGNACEKSEEEEHAGIQVSLPLLLSGQRCVTHEASESAGDENKWQHCK